MSVLPSALDTRGAEYAARREAMLARLADLDAEHAKALAGGGPRYVQRHRDRGKLLARERIELLIDPDSPFLELSPLAGYGTGFPVGGSVVSGIGVVCDTECVLIASDPTVRGGSTNPWTLRKSLRASDIALRNRLPLINLVESGGADLPTQKEIFIPGGQIFRDLTRMSAAGIPTIALVFGSSTAGGAYLPGMSDYVVMVADRAKVFLGGPPLVKMATGEESDDESLGGAGMHARQSGLADFLAADEHDALRIGRSIVARLGRGKPLRGPASAVAGPLHSEDELLGIVPEDLKVPFDPREVIARIVDGSDFDEFKPLYGASLVTGWAALHGHPAGILANARGVLFSEESQKAAQFIQLANQTGVPLLFLQNTTGYMVGSHYEQAGIIKHGAMMINAVSNSRVPHLTVVLGASYGAGNYGMCGRAYDPRFLFSWPSAKSAVMGPAQLAGVLSIVGRQAAAARGEAYDEAADAAMRTAVEEQIEYESQPFFLSGRIYDDGVIDPRDTRTVLGMCLSVIENSAPGWDPGRWGAAGWGAAGPATPAAAGTPGFGVFRP
ncbi:MAG TPA: carboxyl transferase domain-containing protein [Streptosporangiaceae bacterium]|nr:carboxyl transferase domain-containing protein [Streptosporangiaceae bacterium]